MTNEEMYQEVMKNLRSNLPENTIPYDESISKNFLEKLTGKELNYKNVLKNDSDLTKEFDYVVKTYGFDNFYDLYTYADSCDSIQEQIQKGGDKDLGKLNKVTRTVMRNGKPMKTTVYEDSGSDEQDGDSTQEEPKKPVRRKASELSSSSLGGKTEKPTPKEISNLMSQAKNLSGTFDTDCDSYMVLGDSGDIGGLAGFRIEGNFLYLAFIQEDEVTTGVARQAFYELLLRAWKSGLGAMIDDPENDLAHDLFEEYGLTKSKGRYKISKKELENSLGKR